MNIREIRKKFSKIRIAKQKEICAMVCQKSGVTEKYSDDNLFLEAAIKEDDIEFFASGFTFKILYRETETPYLHHIDKLTTRQEGNSISDHDTIGKERYGLIDIEKQFDVMVWKIDISRKLVKALQENMKLIAEMASSIYDIDLTKEEV